MGMVLLVEIVKKPSKDGLALGLRSLLIHE